MGGLESREESTQTKYPAGGTAHSISWPENRFKKISGTEIPIAPAINQGPNVPVAPHSSIK